MAKRTLIGIDWSDAFGAVHTAGKAVLSAFGAGALAKPVEQLESPYLPDWAKSTSSTPAASASPPDAVVSAPDYVVVVHTSGKADTIVNATAVGVYGGRRFDGNGYQHGEKFGKRFSFGYDQPTRVEVAAKSGKVTASDVKQVLFCGGSDPAQHVVGDFNFWSFLDPSWLTYESYGQARNVISPSGDGYAMQRQAANPYWNAQRASSPLSTGTQQRLTAAQQLNATLRQQQAARLAALQAQVRAQQPPAPDPSAQPSQPTDAPTDDLSATSTINGERSSTMTTYLKGTDVLGAGAPLTKRNAKASGFVIKKAPATGRTFTSLVVNRNAKHNPERTLLTARQVAKRAQQVAARAAAMAKKVPVAAVKAAKVAVKGSEDWTELVASDAVGAAVAKGMHGAAALQAQAAKLAKAGKETGALADKYEKKVKSDRAQRAANMLRAQNVTRVHGDVIGDDLEPDSYDVIDPADIIHDEEIFQIIGDGAAAQPDPTHPGYLTDGTPDPNYDPSQSGGGSASAMPGPPDYGAGSPPTIDSAAPQPYVDYQPGPDPSTDTTFYDCPTDDDLPLGAIVYDGSHQPPYRTLGSMSCFYGMVPGLSAPKGGPYSGFEIHDDGWWLFLAGTQPSTNYSGGRNYDKVNEPGYAMVAESQKNNWGPLVGAPTLPGTSTPSWTAGLRFSPSGPNGPRWFWFFDQAPDWAKQPILQARLNDAIVAYKAAVTAGQTDYVNAQLQDKLDAQDAAVAAKQQAQHDAQMAQQQQELDMQQAKLDQAAAAAQAQLDAQERKQALDYFAQHPDELYAGPAPSGGYDRDFDDGGGDAATAELEAAMEPNSTDPIELPAPMGDEEDD